MLLKKLRNSCNGTACDNRFSKNQILQHQTSRSILRPLPCPPVSLTKCRNKRHAPARKSKPFCIYCGNFITTAPPPRTVDEPGDQNALRAICARVRTSFAETNPIWIPLWKSRMMYYTPRPRRRFVFVAPSLSGRVRVARRRRDVTGGTGDRRWCVCERGCWLDAEGGVDFVPEAVCSTSERSWWNLGEVVITNYRVLMWEIIAGVWYSHKHILFWWDTLLVHASRQHLLKVATHWRARLSDTSVNTLTHR